VLGSSNPYSQPGENQVSVTTRGLDSSDHYNGDVEQVQRQMALLWGAEAQLVWTVKTTDDMVRQVDTALLNRSVCRPGDLVVIVAGTPPTTPGATNTIRVHHIGDIVRHDS